ncbi:Pnap_2097 family protein [Mongoliimonas terrestris]|uniref:Pnap_2097 family protein n=1 Tax=Mongoliimonas terrestris TaxID=1709001 RepID=UPI0009496EA7|nr:Pnap_2097 family protein [Mongoliimonas terrestris]
MTRLVWFDEARRLTSDLAGRLKTVPARPRRLPQTVVLGMPHLAAGMLSEHWLLKECGHRHWYLLAESAGLAVPAFRDPDGAPIYAAFSGVTVDAAGFATCREHDPLAIASRLVRLSRTRFVSHHRLTVMGRPVGAVAMTSVFVRRTTAGRNTHVVRTEVPGLPPVGADAAADPDVAAHEAALLPLRSPAPLDPAAPGLTVHPCPTLDFNGADFLYFAAYMAFAERAEWALSRPTAERPLAARRIAFHGNVDPGEPLAVVLAGTPADGPLTRVHLAIAHAATGRPLATVITDRAPSAKGA